MKKIILLLLLLTAAIGVSAQNAVVLYMLDGTKNVVYIKSPDTNPSLIPTITFDEGDMIISGDHVLRVTMSDVKRYIYTNNPSGVDDVKKAEPTLVFNGDVISVTNMPAGTPLEVYGINGSLVRSASLRGDAGQLSLEGLAEGVYIVKVGKTTYKILK